MNHRKIRVLIVDDSASVRQTLKEILESDPAIEVMAVANDPYGAAERLRHDTPDVITLDLEMPRMDGLTFLRKIMAQHPLPVVICSSVSDRGSDNAMAALESGAVEVIHKPRVGTREFLEESRIHICDVIKAAAQVRLKPHAEPIAMEIAPKLTADVILPEGPARGIVTTTEKIVVVGASTGGTEALRIFTKTLPEDAPGMVIVQHMPQHFTTSFAARLDESCRVSVKEAESEDLVVPGQVLIAPGNKHTLIKRIGSEYYVEVRDGPLVCRHRPSVDVLFRSAARYAAQNAVGVILTGMGDDGARGMLELRRTGAQTIAQDEATCVVFGMPAEAIKLGGVEKVLPLQRIAAEVLALCR